MAALIQNFDVPVADGTTFSVWVQDPTLESALCERLAQAILQTYVEYRRQQELPTNPTGVPAQTEVIDVPPETKGIDFFGELLREPIQGGDRHEG